VRCLREYRGVQLSTRLFDPSKIEYNDAMLICLFDIDGTLLSSGGAGKAALESALIEEFRVSLQANVPYSGRTDRAIFRDLLRSHDLEETPDVLGRLMHGYLERLPACLARHQGRVLPGIHQLLSQLCERDRCAVGLLTGNVRAGAEAKLEHFGLKEHFRFGGFGDDHYDRDDVARDALAAVWHEVGLEVRPEQIWIIGDTPLDVRCARAIGARVAAVATGVHSYEELVASAPDVVLRDLSDAGPLTRCWN
jgi:phosphoglycolate phosphatase